MDRKGLPIGIQTFREIREGGHYYVDKSAHAKRLIAEGKHYFLSRPRRFGKSLFVDTLKELFEGSEGLFRGLAIHDRWDWSVRHPVVRFSFARGAFNQPDQLQKIVLEQLADHEDRAGVEPKHETASGRFAHLIGALRERSGQRVAVLVDEYDKPITDALDTPDLARANRDLLRGFYGTLKDSDADIRFSFLTGVSKFSKAGLFSGLNNLIDITMEPEFSSVCGYTDHDLDTVFEPELGDLDREGIREWYNGYSWRGAERVYNPYSILLLFRKREFASWWFETGTPSFLIDRLKARGGSLGLEKRRVGNELLSSFDIGEIEVPALLFQTGYLTIASERRVGGEARYRLDYPNREVRQSLHRQLLRALAPEAAAAAEDTDLREALVSGDFEGVEAHLRALFAGIPFQWHTTPGAGKPVAEYEAYYASVVHACLMGTGLVVRTEDMTNLGRVDLTVETGTGFCLFEFKVARAGRTGGAMRQLRERRYAEKHSDRGLPVHLVAVEFDPEERNLALFEVERA